MRKHLTLHLATTANPLWAIFEVNFLRNLAAAILTPVMPLFFKQFVTNDSHVSMIFAGGYAVALVSHMFSDRIVARLHKRRTLFLVLAAFTLCSLLFTQINHTATVVLMFGVYQFLLALFIMDVSLYIKHYSRSHTLAENEGKLGSFGNIGWLVGPLLGGLLAARYNFEVVFLVSSCISFLALISFYFSHRPGEQEKHTISVQSEKSFKENAREFMRDPNLRRTYLNNAGLGFIYSMWDMLPVLMLKIGATLPIIGLTKALMGVPLTVFEYPIGQLADKRTGERRIFIWGYGLAATCTFLLGFTSNLRLFITIFFVAAVGVAMLEMTRDSYFFRQIKERQLGFVGVYRTSDALPYLVGQLCAVIILSFVAIEWWFIIGGGASLLFVLNAYRLRDLSK